MNYIVHLVTDIDIAPRYENIAYFLYYDCIDNTRTRTWMGSRAQSGSGMLVIKYIPGRLLMDTLYSLILGIIINKTTGKNLANNCL